MGTSARSTLLVALMLGATACGGKKRARQEAEPIVTTSFDAAVAETAGASTSRARPETSARYSKALHRGRSLGDKGDYAGAMAAFREALEELPGEARALSELGWVAFKYGDLEAAEVASTASIAAADPTRQPMVRAASLYNRGRINEERGDTTGALEDYRESLALRPHDVVEQRLSTLSGQVVQALAPRPLAGPFATLADACKTFGLAQPAGGCTAPTVKGPNELADPEPPYLEVRIIGENPGGYEPTDSYDTCRLAIRLASGWFVSEGASCTVYEWGDAAVRELSWQPADAGGVRVALWRHEYSDSTRGYDRDGRRYQTRVTTEVARYCGVGPSGVPSCTPGIPLRVEEAGDFTYSELVPYELVATLGKGGALTITQRGVTTLDRDARGLLGRRTLTFP